ncbi:glycosyltransferase family 2 protein [Thermococcus sp.]|uniref:glycosyltransferase family 2 protein n=1 Tax=Thermococcus sp. TaxID=35749 RepID=UPI002626D48D|nr:glycosyltransferase family 2 protein [Thermococcus sp.]
MYKGKKIGISIPAYNEEKLIGKTIKEIPDFVDRIYVVDDASIDGTSKKVEEIMKTDKRVQIIKHKENQGVGGAIISGWKRGLNEEMDILVVMAGDNQMDPAYLPDLLNPIVEGRADFSKGTRFFGNYWKEMPKVRVFGTLLLNILNKIASGYWNVNDPQNGYVAISTDALKKIDLDTLYRGYAFENDVLVKANVAGLRVVNVPVRIRYKIGETSKLKILQFATSTSKFLLKSFLWRVWVKYIKKGHPLGFLYYGGFIMIISALPLAILSTGISVFSLIGGIITFSLACIIEAEEGSR